MARMTVQDLVRRLREAFGEELACVSVYGSGAEDPARDRDLNVLVLARRLDFDALERAAKTAMRDWKAAGNPAPMLMTTWEWHRSADAFPIDYADILHRHRTVFGELPTDGIRVDREHLRLQLEHEARGKVMHLRAGILGTEADPVRERELLAHSVSAMTAICRALVRLHDETMPAGAEAVIRRAAAIASFDATPFITALAARRGEKVADSRRVLAGYLAGAEALVRHLDAHDANRAATP
jgi:uncharacterized protein (DUF1778 family)